MKTFTKKMLGMAAAMLATTGMSTAAQAADYLFTFTGADVTASGALTTSNTDNGAGGFAITYVGGTTSLFGAITGLVPTGANGQFIYDNLLFPAGPNLLSNGGFLFSTTSGVVNVYRATSNAGDALTGFVAGGYVPDASGERFAGTFSITAVPEPTSWALMIGGFGLVGGAMRYRRRSTKVAFAA